VIASSESMERVLGCELWEGDIRYLTGSGNILYSSSDTVLYCHIILQYIPFVKTG
jgi:hypothetical protein